VEQKDRMQNLSTVVGGAAAAVALAAALSCGGSSSPSTSPSGGCTPSNNANTLVVMNDSVCPQALTVARGSQVTIVNQDSRAHDMTSDPHPEHTDCPELNQIGFLNAGQSRASGNLNTARRCGIHDHSNPNSNALKATITIQ
jgi:plastocyanin